MAGVDKRLSLTTPEGILKPSPSISIDAVEIRLRGLSVMAKAVGEDPTIKAVAVKCDAAGNELSAHKVLLKPPHSQAVQDALAALYDAVLTSGTANGDLAAGVVS